MEKASRRDFEIRNEEIEDILGRVPNWIIRSGITVILVIIVLVLIISYFFKYPDFINSTIVITTDNVPATIIAKSSGKITNIFVKDNQIVAKNDYLALIDNPASFQNVIELKGKLNNIGPNILDCPILDSNYSNFQSTYLLGDIQLEFSTFRKNVEDYKIFIQNDYSHKKILSNHKQISTYRLIYNKLQKQQGILKQKFELGAIQFSRDSTLYSKRTIALVDLEKSKISLLDNKFSFESNLTSIDNTQISINQLEQNIIELEQDYREKQMSFQLLLKESYDDLQNQIKLWEQTYVLKAPIDGSITFTKYWSINQNVTIGDKVMTVVPKKVNIIIGKLTIPLSGSGKVKVGQKVNIKLLNYPYMEFGMLQGVIKSISMVPIDNTYIAEIEFPNGLITNYGKRLELSQEMQGSAEIITNDLRLIERFIYPIKALFKSQM